MLTTLHAGFVLLCLHMQGLWLTLLTLPFLCLWTLPSVVCCRLPLSQATACMSLGMFLSLCFSAPGLEVLGRPLHSGFVR